MEADFKSFYMFVRRQWKNLNTKIKEKLDEVGLTSQHVSYLVTLASNKNIKIKELNDLVGNDPALTTRVLTTLFSRSSFTPVLVIPTKPATFLLPLISTTLVE